MSAEATIHALLSPLVVGKIWPDVAPSSAGLPRIVYQQVGGETINYTEGTLPDKENARMQIVCWAATRMAAINLMKQAEALGARVSGHEMDTNLYSSMQDFSIWTTR